ncbi:myo-inositol 2-dehydrogenase / D-chiro-inositol 1-dehydrogenase [Luteibacter sp. UNC138MFCol5.1]|uniref:Gfo/Idh/MocA family oxidoreductase n=1 Tax=Luteibacter sp. UNC138MFCol5.1 TaxID=1502774 RepID=UPI0008C3FE6A|nr:Gfo/Idh/MocA family oxidoreductase [Luteibacter sp. UNC138MFCol5.1]SEP07180.1 myo-inositol 2-dehydrogenase / D-chiro-inositol 1-dehydrogenase [Luteibacter sp. UNC138MFCol5.1]
MMTSLRIGLAGLGRLGQRYAENLARAVPRAELVAVCSPVDAERAWAREALAVPAVHETYEQLLADPSVDAVFLVTPTSLHASQIEQALDAGKHVFCEKPLSLDTEDCRRAAAHAAASDKRAMVGFVRRFDESYRHAFQHIEAGGIGRPFLVYSQTTDLADPSGAFLKFAPTSGGIFLDCSVHDIDLARWLLGRPKAVKVYATGTVAMYPPLEAMGDVDNGIATVEFEGGRMAMFYASRTQAHGHDTHTDITGTAGRLSVGRNPRADRVEIADASGIRNTVLPSFYERFAPAFVTQARHFVDAILDGTPFDLTMDDAVEATRIAVALRESLHRGQPVTL